MNLMRSAPTAVADYITAKFMRSLLVYHNNDKQTHYHHHAKRIAIHWTEPIQEAWTTLSVLAGITSRIKLGTLVTSLIYRHPSVLAKNCSTLDVIVKEVFLGIGAS